MDTTNLQLTDYLQALQVTLKSHHEGCRIVMLEAGTDTQEFDRFIDRQFRLRLQHYMLTSRARMLETRLAIKSRSTHFLLYRHDQLLAVLRATPAPFEWVSLAQQHVSPTVALSRHVEFSRLMSYTPNQLPIAVNGLLAAATEWAIRHGYNGVTALCRSQQLRFYQRFGLMPIASNALHIDQRARGDYWVLSAEWRQILAAVQPPDPAVGHVVQKPLECHLPRC
ncbi:hypothetical protein FE275_20195 [Pseudomonas koreensis]|uniref:hypothetical protein n=1 Tax=Pseudomonas koreensis TaxID=198620 RepID=UPI0012386CB5|nr:hypothetical protein [Pseudomonas koreensis]KAA8737695.1 hypothetical protein FE275_20195 [Pseudomonas koreensis]